jgi:hypothetical protein
MIQLIDPKRQAELEDQVVSMAMAIEKLEAHVRNLNIGLERINSDVYSRLQRVEQNVERTVLDVYGTLDRRVSTYTPEEASYFRGFSLRSSIDRVEHPTLSQGVRNE